LDRRKRSVEAAQELDQIVSKQPLNGRKLGRFRLSFAWVNANLGGPTTDRCFGFSIDAWVIHAGTVA